MIDAGFEYVWEFEVYEKQHVPIHYVLVVGYDDAEQVVFVHDCSHEKVQKISYDAFEKSLDVRVPGMSKRNTLRTFTLPKQIPSEFEIAKKGFSYKAERFVNPLVRLFGVPALRKLAKEILEWENRSVLSTGFPKLQRRLCCLKPLKTVMGCGSGKRMYLKNWEISIM